MNDFRKPQFHERFNFILLVVVSFQLSLNGKYFLKFHQNAKNNQTTSTDDDCVQKFRQGLENDELLLIPFANDVEIRDTYMFFFERRKWFLAIDS